MAFYGKTFIFDNIPSEFFNLYLGELRGSGESTSPASNDVNLLTQKIFRRPDPLFWGAEQTPALQFPLSVYSPVEIRAGMFSEISAWLFGQMAYKTLRICQNDMVDVYFNAFLTAPNIIRVGNIIRGFNCTVVCDSPWGWKEPKTHTETYTGSQYVNDTIYILNESANNYYTYPTTFEMIANNYGGLITITNTTDSSTRELIYEAVAGETVTMDCKNQIITSVNGHEHPLNYFNENESSKNWFRLVAGWNTVTVEGYIASLEITHEIAVKIGG